jgi:hypothetical protein
LKRSAGTEIDEVTVSRPLRRGSFFEAETGLTKERLTIEIHTKSRQCLMRNVQSLKPWAPLADDLVRYGQSYNTDNKNLSIAFLQSGIYVAGIESEIDF